MYKYKYIHKGDQTLEEVAQGGGAVFILGDTCIQNLDTDLSNLL